MDTYAMTTEATCEESSLFDGLCHYLQKLSDGESLSFAEDKSLRRLLDRYWDSSCPAGKPCRANNCQFARIGVPWIEYHGYVALYDLLDHFNYVDVKPLRLKHRPSIDALDASWARRPGHFNP